MTSFRKLHGCGNHFVVLFESGATVAEWQKRAGKICEPAFGVFADGLLIITESKSADFEVLMFNPDSSLMGMCGNGIRCVCRFLYLEKIVPSTKTEISFIVEGRQIFCSSFDSGKNVRVDMGKPNFAPEAIPTTAKKELIGSQVYLAGKERTISAVSMGNAHCVLFDEALDLKTVTSVGPQIENDAIFPKRTCVEFCKINSKEDLSLEVWERGAGRTLACGTACCAAVVCGIRLGFLGQKVRVKVPGGEVTVQWKEGESVFLSGPTAEVFTGELEPRFLG